MIWPCTVTVGTAGGAGGVAAAADAVRVAVEAVVSSGPGPDAAHPQRPHGAIPNASPLAVFMSGGIATSGPYENTAIFAVDGRG
jgi:hypothetical protein